jgi:hypothetical protein
LIPQFGEKCNIVKKSYSYTTQIRKQNDQRLVSKGHGMLRREAGIRQLDIQMPVSPTVRIGICRRFFTETAMEKSRLKRRLVF